MRKIENECCGCEPELRCLGSHCPNRNVVRFYCDRCGEETQLYHYDDMELCADCLLKEFEIVDGSEWI